MPPSDPTDKPKKPASSDLPDLPPLPEDTDLLELNVDLDPGAPEPVGEIPVDAIDDLFADGVDVVELTDVEPEPSEITRPMADKPLHLVDDDLEDFATQEELPILPWTLHAELLELGERVPAVLEPTLERSVWERPDPGDDATIHVTVRLRMLDISAELSVEPGESSRLRLGRDVIGGRLLIATD